MVGGKRLFNFTISVYDILDSWIEKKNSNISAASQVRPIPNLYHPSIPVQPLLNLQQPNNVFLPPYLDSWLIDDSMTSPLLHEPPEILYDNNQKHNLLLGNTAVQFTTLPTRCVSAGHQQVASQTTASVDEEPMVCGIVWRVFWLDGGITRSDIYGTLCIGRGELVVAPEGAILIGVEWEAFNAMGTIEQYRNYNLTTRVGFDLISRSVNIPRSGRIEFQWNDPNNTTRAFGITAVGLDGLPNNFPAPSHLPNFPEPPSMLYFGQLTPDSDSPNLSDLTDETI